MPPMDINDWWLAAAAAAATGFVAPSATAATEVGKQVGVVTSVRAGVVSATNERVVYIGNSVAFGERFKTDSTGIIHMLFMDQSSMTLGPNSELIIDEFAFHPEERRGNIAVNLIKGSLRVVGGFISKLTSPKGTNSALVRTATATIGIRGGISIVETQPDQTQGTFLFGEHMDVLSADGQTGPRVTRPGFSVIANRSGMGIPFRFSPVDMANFVSQFENHQASRSTSGGNLISTNDRPRALNSPDSSIAPNRVQQVSTEIRNQTPGNSLRKLTGSDSTQVQS
ncbi:MAG: FecR domain-containing protein [Burkholderiales bacterium]